MSYSELGNVQTEYKKVWTKDKNQSTKQETMNAHSNKDLLNSGKNHAVHYPHQKWLLNQYSYSTPRKSFVSTVSPAAFVF